MRIRSKPTKPQKRRANAAKTWIAKTGNRPIYATAKGESDSAEEAMVGEADEGAIISRMVAEGADSVAVETTTGHLLGIGTRRMHLVAVTDMFREVAAEEPAIAAEGGPLRGLGPDLDLHQTQLQPVHPHEAPHHNELADQATEILVQGDASHRETGQVAGVKGILKISGHVLLVALALTMRQMKRGADANPDGNTAHPLPRGLCQGGHLALARTRRRRQRRDGTLPPPLRPRVQNRRPVAVGIRVAGLLHLL